ncbi:DUF4199 domain-containing protein [Aliikangiella coralliicola]|uniref:DUF4199 domain-containing protein n=1 Tax=Aliikangiella coralliicola TaxID=2592383 RepID=A0A545TW34_9GAMM|nr:DUF4199 domain-containing protein [Aliikangiella coralliicola]TQV81433.1 DUF4199 domain-containing protein [Aliikangiella coralliicola]
MQQKILKYGLISGGVIVLIPVLGSMIIGTGPESYRMGEIIGYSTMILSLLVIFMAVNEYKKNHPDESISAKQIMLIGCGVSAIAGLMFGIYNWIYVTFLVPDFMDQYFNYYIETIRNGGGTQQEIDTQIADLQQQKEMFMNPLVSFFVMFVTVFAIGFIISIVSALAQSSKVKQVNQASI